ncbi:MAG: HD domain-containing protein [Pseudomonadota bacterium]
MTDLKRIANFLFEAGMLKKTPRTGYRFLGSGSESVADHSYRVILIGYVLAELIPGVDRGRVVELCLVHDLTEARTGDLNYVYKEYTTVDVDSALESMTEGLAFGDSVKSLVTEFNDGRTEEARLARDADCLDLLLELKEQHDLGNKYAESWLRHITKRISTPIGKKLAEEIIETDFCSWWFDKKR